jgi:hypothetical protein
MNENVVTTVVGKKLHAPLWDIGIGGPGAVWGEQ